CDILPCRCNSSSLIMSKKLRPKTEPVASEAEALYPRVFVARSKIHGLGLFAGENIEWGRRIIEYQGQPLSSNEVRRRQTFYDSIAFICLRQFSDGLGIAGVIGANESRFINHSLTPNIAALRENDWRTMFYSLEHIARREELTFNYGFDPTKSTA